MSIQKFRWFCRKYLRLHWHSQNLNERKDGTCGPMWRHGRAWFYPFCQTDEEAERNYKRGLCIGVSWTIPTPFCHISFGRGGYNDEDLSLSFGCGLFVLWLRFENIVPKRWRKYWDCYSPRDLSVAIHSGAIWWNLWRDDNEWNNRVPWYRHGNFNPADFFLGRQICTTRILKEPFPIKIPMPEGEYNATAKIEERTWKRARWPRVLRRVSVDLEVPAPPKFAGKGENSWDCDDDGIYGTVYDGEDIEAAIGKYIDTVMKYRVSYGMPTGLEVGS